MTLLAVDSIEPYNAAADMTRLWTSSGTISINTASPRTGSRALLIGANAGSFTRTVAGADEHATFIAGCAFKHSASGNTMQIMAFCADAGATQHVTLERGTNGELIVRRGQLGTILGTSANGLLPTDTYKYVEMKATLHDSTGTVRVLVDGSEVLNLTGQDTKNGGTDAVFDTFRFGPVGSDGFNAYYDDIYIMNGAGSAPNNDLLGDCRVRCLNPNGNGNSSQFLGSDGNSTDNYLLVDDATTSGTADYVESSTVDQVDTYTFADLSESAGSVFGVQISTYAQKTDAGARSLAQVTRRSGTDYASSDIALSTSFAFQTQMREQDPSTSAAWTIAGVNAAEFGHKCR